MVTLHIHEQTAERLREQARSAGLSLEEYLASLAASGGVVGPSGGVNGKRAAVAPPVNAWREFVASTEAWGRERPSDGRVDDSREGIYEDRA